MKLLSIALIISFFFAMNIGASGTAASMGAAYGGGAIKKRWHALALVSIFVFLGAFIGGGEVVKTIGGGIIPSELLNVQVTIIILASACITLFIANQLGIPLSTSEVTVGSVVGVGIAYGALYINKIIFIVSVWIVMPFTAFFIAYGLGKIVPILENKLSTFKNQLLIHEILVGTLIAAGCYEAFSAGMNNVANAVGPLVGAGLISTRTAMLWGALFVSLGALTLGGRVLETNGKKITDLSVLKGSMVSFTSGSLVIIASIFGLPVPLTQATTMSIFGIGASDRGRGFWKSDIVKRIIKIWITSPVYAMLISFSLVKTVIDRNLYITIIVLGCAIILLTTIGIVKTGQRKQVKKKSTGEVI